MAVNFNALTKDYSGELYFNDTARHLAVRTAYSTDASVYQEMPVAVAIPKDAADILLLITFAREHGLTLVPRTAGTSLAGQVVSHGVIVDVSKYMNAILEVNQQEKWVRVQPGVVRDDLNAWLKPLGLLFGPETSTSSRAMIGGMIGNNSCGLHSRIWGNTRDNLLEVSAILADGTELAFGPVDRTALTFGPVDRDTASREHQLYADILSIIEDPANRAAIAKNFPKKTVTRRNSGYALDHLVDQLDHSSRINLSSLIAGSEGTLCFVTEAKLKLIDLPPKEVGMVAVHCRSLQEALGANLIAVQAQCAASELVDHVILEQAINNAEQAPNRFFLVGEPNSILMVEFFDDTQEGLRQKCEDLITALKNAGLGYAFPILTGNETNSAWNLRKAGLGLLRNIKGDAQPVNLIEDCAVAVEDLPAYIADLEALLKRHDTRYSMYAHAGDGELHVEPMIDLKSATGRQLFKDILTETAQLVKKYNGALSGEHGDGRLRGQFIPVVMGPEVYNLFKQVKHIFDDQGLFNKGKITDTPDMLSNLRYAEKEPISAAPGPISLTPGSAPQTPGSAPQTIFDFSPEEGILRLTEKCSGSGDCRKTHITGGTMCPSYMATRNEMDTTRARANVLRQYLNKRPEILGQGKEAEIVKDVLDLCLACKGCKTECPSSVDVTKLRAEFLHHYQKENGIPFRTRMIGAFSTQMRLASKFAPVYNALVRNRLFRKTINRLLGFHPKRSLPEVAGLTLKDWHRKRNRPENRPGGKSENRPSHNPGHQPRKTVYLFCDEFTNYNDAETGKKTILLLEHLGYQVLIPEHTDSGRAYLSKGLLLQARACAEQNVNALHDLITEETPLIGIEPSAILSFRDEYKSLLDSEGQKKANALSPHVYLFEEWFYKEMQRGNIQPASFTTANKQIILHGHCHQKALSDMHMAQAILSLPENFSVRVLPTGCCGMAGSFGYEKEHFDVSMKIGNLVLFPSIKGEPETTIIAASGTSCRHQVKDGTGRKALHPAEILFDALCL
jgi:FAD/FMN-containing dehydrogenase/Fe-S oxidoreductase